LAENRRMKARSEEDDMENRTAPLEGELLLLERQYWQAMKDKNLDAATRLTEFPCIITGAQGVGSLDETSYASMLNASSWSIEEFTIEDDVQVRMLSVDVALIAYKIHEDLTVQGKLVTIDAADASVWVRREGQWKCAMHTESLLGDPFGRDRQPAAKS
jgi:hypothetical protein